MPSFGHAVVRHSTADGVHADVALPGGVGDGRHREGGRQPLQDVLVLRHLVELTVVHVDDRGEGVGLGPVVPVELPTRIHWLTPASGYVI